MGIQYRIVELNSGRFALERKISVLGISPLGWDLVCVQHPEYSNLVQTFETVEQAKEYFIDPMGIKRIVENLTTSST